MAQSINPRQSTPNTAVSQHTTAPKGHQVPAAQMQQGFNPGTCNSQTVILIMGRAGSGKTSFIQQAIGHMNQEVVSNINHTLACNKTIRIDSFSGELNGRQYLFLDSTGSDKLEFSNKKEAESLCEQLCNKPDIHGILYIHSLLDDRMDRYGVFFLKLLETVFGRSSMNNFMFLTSFWDEVKPEVAERKAKELQEVFWAGMIDGGATVKRLDGTMPECVHNILEEFSFCSPTVLSIKDEMIHQGKPFMETSVASLVDQRLREERRGMFPRVKRELAKKSAEELRCEVLDLRIKCMDLEGEIARLTAELKSSNENPKEEISSNSVLHRLGIRW